ncbi:MAG: hypothetical protein WCO98_12230 [bacterium]
MKLKDLKIGTQLHIFLSIIMLFVAILGALSYMQVIRDIVNLQHFPVVALIATSAMKSNYKMMLSYDFNGQVSKTVDEKLFITVISERIQW